MKVPLLDLKLQYESMRGEIVDAIEALCETQYFILGPPVAQLEQEVADYCGAGYAVGVSSGSDALLIALMAEEIGAGDEVITSTYTFFATGGAIARVGARPVFVDIDPVTFNLVPEQVAARVTERTRAVIPVHLYGQCADMNPILELARERDLVVIEDAAQAIGAEYEGRRAGVMGDYGCFSFFPSKNLGAFGDGGMVLTNTAERQRLLESLRNHGADPKYYHKRIGGNFRLAALQATVLSVKLKYLDGWTEGRQENAARYRELFAAAGLLEMVRLPEQAAYNNRHVYNQFCIRMPAESRDRVWEGLRVAGVGCEVYYPVPLHLQECFEQLGYQAGDLPESEAAARESLALPIFPELTDEQQQFVVAELKRLLM